MGATIDGSPLYGAKWYLTGLYEGANRPEYDQLWPADSAHPEYERGFFSDSVSVSNLDNYVVPRCDNDESSTILIDVMNELRAGNAVALIVYQYTIEGKSRGHVITLQGYTYQTVENSSDLKITGIFIADSDDNMDYVYEGHVGSSYAPNKLVYIL